ncbi:hypothetical protein SETIT_9G118500v2 [Setaria italica]|uniref:Uncharacterized protein n=1 Tax=Setaria italica TaxID=4555 RepID=K4AMF0_SETIT|nr:hypothetical protein SETIT_9G118500v2 [Setaria italica]
MNVARHSAFFASRVACPSGNSGEFSARRICRYRDSTAGRFRARSSAVATATLRHPSAAVLLTSLHHRLEREGFGLE